MIQEIFVRLDSGATGTASCQAFRPSGRDKKASFDGKIKKIPSRNASKPTH
jgi:hypothetical protein